MTIRLVSKISISIVLGFAASTAVASVTSVYSCQAFFGPQLPAVRTPLEVLTAASATKKPGFLAKRLAAVDRLGIDPRRADEFLKSLKPEERSFIYMVLLDHPKMMFGDFAANLKNIRGQIESPVTTGGWLGYSFYEHFPRAKQKDYAQKMKITVEDGFALLEAASKKEAGAKEVRFASALRYGGDRAGKSYEVRIDLLDESSSQEEFYRHGRSISDFGQLSGYEVFKDFFAWMAKKPAREEYAKLLMEYSVASLLSSYEKDLIRKSIGEWHRESLLEGDNYESMTVLAPKKKTNVKRPIRGAIRRIRQAGIRNTKIEIGLAAHALSRAPLKPVTLDLDYVPVAEKMIRSYAPALDQARIGAFVLDPSEYSQSARRLRSVLTGMFTDMKTQSDQLTRILASLEKPFETLSDDPSSSAELAKLTEFADLVEDDFHAATAELRNSLARIHDLETAMSQASEAHPEIRAELTALQSFIAQVNQLAGQQANSTRALIQNLRERVGHSELKILESLSN